MLFWALVSTFATASTFAFGFTILLLAASVTGFHSPFITFRQAQTLLGYFLDSGTSPSAFVLGLSHVTSDDFRRNDTTSTIVKQSF